MANVVVNITINVTTIIIVIIIILLSSGHKLFVKKENREMRKKLEHLEACKVSDELKVNSGELKVNSDELKSSVCKESVNPSMHVDITDENACEIVNNYE